MPAAESQAATAGTQYAFTAVWTETDGQPAEDEDSFEIIGQPGPDHCGWESADFLTIAWPPGTEIQRIGGDGDTRTYIRDPNGVVDRDISDELDLNAELPGQAVFTGYRTEDAELWLGPDDGAEAVYLVVNDAVERWPEATHIGCD